MKLFSRVLYLLADEDRNVFTHLIYIFAFVCVMSVLAAATIEVPSYLPVLYAAYLEKSGGVSKFLSGPSASGGGMLLSI